MWHISVIVEHAPTGLVIGDVSRPLVSPVGDWRNGRQQGNTDGWTKMSGWRPDFRFSFADGDGLCRGSRRTPVPNLGSNFIRGAVFQMPRATPCKYSCELGAFIDLGVGFGWDFVTAITRWAWVGTMRLLGGIPFLLPIRIYKAIWTVPKREHSPGRDQGGGSYRPVTFSRRNNCPSVTGTLKMCSKPVPLSGTSAQLPGSRVSLHSAP